MCLRKLLLISLLALVSHASFSQIRFVPGYFVDEDGRRTDCLIKDWDKLSSPDQIDYKLTAESEPVTASAESFKEIRIAEKTYVRAMVEVEISSVDRLDLSYSSTPEMEPRLVLLRKLNEGQAVLYSLWTEGKSLFFFSMDEGTTIKPLIHKLYTKGTLKVYENVMFRQQLYNAFGTEKFKIEDYASLPYNTDLLKLFNRYNGSESRAGQSKLKVHIGPFVEGGLSNCHFMDVDPLAAAPVFSLGTMPILSAGVEAEIFLPVMRGKVRIALSPAYTHMSKTVQSSLEHNDGYDESVNYSTLDFGVSPRYYMYLKGSHRLFADVGITPTFALGNSTATYTYFRFPPKPRVEIFYHVGLGYSLGDHLNIGLRACTSQQFMSNYYFVGLRNPSIRLKVGYLF